MSLDPGGASDDSILTGYGCFGPSDKISDWIASRLAEGPTGIAVWGLAIPPWCHHRVGTVESFLNIDICICLDAKTSCKTNETSYSLTNNCHQLHNYNDYIGPGAEHRSLQSI
jgi:hypothetical protein